MEQTQVYAEEKGLANRAWLLVRDWESFARWSVGRQLCASLDSVGANLAEGDGRFSDADALHFFVMARGSLRESGYWIDVSADRELIQMEFCEELRRSVDSIRKQINGLINYRRSNNNKNLIKEERSGYQVEADQELHAGRSTLHAPFTEEMQFNEN